MQALMSFQEMEKAAEVMAKSGLFPAWNTKEKMFSLMLICRSEGIDPIRAVNRYDNVQGRITKRSEAKLEDFIAAGGKVEWHDVSDKCFKATFTPPNGGKPLTHQYDWQDVVRAGNQNKDSYKKYPKDMLRSRLVSGALRMVWPQAGSLMYSPEEAMDFQGTPEAAAAPLAPMFAAPGTAKPTKAKKNAVPVATEPEEPAIDVQATEIPQDVSEPVLTPEGVMDADQESEVLHPIHELDKDKVLKFLYKIKWLKAGQDTGDLSEQHWAQIESNFEGFKKKVEAM
jgi:hypothetical protein